MGGIAAWLLAERGRLLPWIPVAMGSGIGIWFALPVEPGAVVYWLVALVAVLGFAAWQAPVALAQPLGALVLALCCGFLAIAARADLVAAPVLGFRYHGPLEGRIVAIDRAATGRLRLTLDQVRLNQVAPERMPRQVRVALHGGQDYVAPVPGMQVMMTAHLMPPDGAVEPGAFDYRRLVWFRGLGAVGYTRTPVLRLAPPGPWEAAVARLRHHLSAAIQTAIPGEPGAFAAAMMTGDRSGMGPGAVAALRDSSLYHLVSISGTHMGLLVAFVFGAVQTLLALAPPVVPRVQPRKVAAVFALLAGLAYLVLAGADVPTERSYIMVAVMLGAVLLDRRALSLRSITLAAMVLLLVQPETVVEPGFQMSFAATVALVVGFGPLNAWMVRYHLPRPVRAALALVAASVLAGTATAPFAAAHFNRFATYGYVANLIAGPVMGAAVMPAGVIAAVLGPVGLAGPALWVLGQGTAVILWVAAAVAGLDGAVSMIPTPAAWILPLTGLAGCGLVLLRGRGRLVAMIGLLVAGLGWGQGSRPTLLVTADGGLLGLLGPEGRALSAPRGNAFTAGQWLQNDGDTASQAMAAARPGFIRDNDMVRFAVGRISGIHLRGRGAAGRVEEACTTAPLVILAAEADQSAPAGCLLIDRQFLAMTGPLAIQPAAEGLSLQSRNGQTSRRWQMGTGRSRSDATVLSDTVAQVIDGLQAPPGIAYFVPIPLRIAGAACEAAPDLSSDPALNRCGSDRPAAPAP